jgi:hypothetical protein
VSGGPDGAGWRLRSPLPVASVVGGLWGLAGYLLLWGHTPLIVHRTFVVSPVGTAVLLPVRLVLWGIHLVEDRIVGHPFGLASSNEWIGLLAAGVGAGIGAISVVLVRPVLRRVRGPR